jgi:hypothetical protein
MINKMKKTKTHIILRIIELAIFAILLASNFNIIEPIAKELTFFLFSIIALLETFLWTLETTKNRRHNFAPYLYLFILFDVCIYIIPILFNINNGKVPQLMQAISITLIVLYWIILMFINLSSLNNRLENKKKESLLHN